MEAVLAPEERGDIGDVVGGLEPKDVEVELQRLVELGRADERMDDVGRCVEERGHLGPLLIVSEELKGVAGRVHRREATGAPFLSLIHISEPTRLLSISYAGFCLKKK